MTQITLLRPDDWHLHLRDDHFMRDVVSYTANVFARALIMPNLTPPITTVEAALGYRERILSALQPSNLFRPYMALYLTPATTVAQVEKVAATPEVLGIKLYPAGATTNSAAGVSSLDAVYPVLAAMEAHGVVLQIHGESTDPTCDPFDREAVFIEHTLQPVIRRFPKLRFVFEHATTLEAVEFVRSLPAGQVAATLTPQHLLYDRRALFAGGVRPHFFCLPVLKREKHRHALLAAATSGDPRFFLGTDSAPHPRSRKESACGCAGIFSAHAAIELYAEAFASVGALNKLESFASRFGAQFYGLPLSTQTITLEERPRRIPPSLPFGDDVLVPMRADEEVAFSVV
jgi:dihydroorotase